MCERERVGIVNFVRLCYPHVTISASLTRLKQSLRAGCVHAHSESGALRYCTRLLHVALLGRSIDRYFHPPVIVWLPATIGCTNCRWSQGRLTYCNTFFLTPLILNHASHSAFSSLFEGCLAFISVTVPIGYCACAEHGGSEP